MQSNRESRYALSEEAFGEDYLFIDRQVPEAWITTDTLWRVQP